jgi:hypothetical protein
MDARALCLAGCVALTGCATAPPPPVWMRLDGQSTLTNPVLGQQFKVDTTICAGDMQKANVSGTVVPTGSVFVDAMNDVKRSSAVGDVFKGCMAEKGYMLVAADQIDATRQQFLANAAAKSASPPPKTSAKQ